MRPVLISLKSYTNYYLQSTQIARTVSSLRIYQDHTFENQIIMIRKSIDTHSFTRSENFQFDYNRHQHIATRFQFEEKLFTRKRYESRK